MGILNANDSLAQFWLYLAILGELSSDLSFTVGFFKSLSFSHYQLAFSGEKRTYLATPLCLSWLKKTRYQKNIIFGILH